MLRLPTSGRKKDDRRRRLPTTRISCFRRCAAMKTLTSRRNEDPEGTMIAAGWVVVLLLGGGWSFHCRRDGLDPRATTMSIDRSISPLVMTTSSCRSLRLVVCLRGATRITCLLACLLACLPVLLCTPFLHGKQAVAVGIYTVLRGRSKKNPCNNTQVSSGRIMRQERGWCLVPPQPVLLIATCCCALLSFSWIVVRPDVRIILLSEELDDDDDDDDDTTIIVLSVRYHCSAVHRHHPAVSLFLPPTDGTSTDKHTNSTVRSSKPDVCCCCR